MVLLQKTWFRIIISVIGAGFIKEFIQILTGEPNRLCKTGGATTFIIASLLFFVVTFIVEKFNTTKI